MNRKDVANGTVHQQLAYLAVMRSIAIVKGDAHLVSGLFNGVENTQGALLIDGHRFFSDHITARVQRPHDIVIVGAVHSGHDDDIGAGFADHVFKLCGFPGGYRSGPLIF
ncbi:hypothetical protein D3C81_1709490 [compost metagenome]